VAKKPQKPHSQERFPGFVVFTATDVVKNKTDRREFFVWSHGIKINKIMTIDNFSHGGNFFSGPGTGTGSTLGHYLEIWHWDC
jgi:hypothetical protein